MAKPARTPSLIVATCNREHTPKKQINMAKEPEKSKLELAKEAQAEVQETLTTKRIEFLEALTEFKGIGGVDDVKSSVLKIAEHFKDGIPFSFLQMTAPDAILSKVLKDLLAEKKIEKEGKKGNVVIKLAVAN